MEKSLDAFRTISEVADDLDLPQHVLRFWETRFPQVRPLKRAGGRRYYRPSDVLLLKAIRKLLYDEGYTIKGVQRLLKDQGTRDVRAGSAPMALDLATLEAAVPPNADDIRAFVLEVEDRPDSEDRKSDTRDGAAHLPALAGDQGEIAFGADAVREALAVIEDCERILRGLVR